MKVPIYMDDHATTRLDPRELLSAGALSALPAGPSITTLSGDALDDERATEELLRHFGALTLEGFGCASRPLAVCAAAAVLRYIGENRPAVFSQVTQLSTSDAHGWMPLPRLVLRW